MLNYIIDRPLMDEATQYTFQWCKEIVDFLNNQGESILDLPNNNAVRENVEKGLKENPSALYIHYGHGDQDRLVGDDALPVVDLNNVDLLSGREVYTMACLSARVLGVTAYNKKCVAFWGYVEVVSFTTDALEEFKEALNYGFYLRFKGKGFKERVDETKAKMQEITNKLIADGKFMAASCMDSNMNALVCYDGGAPPPEACPVSRVIARLFGYRVLTTLRKIRDRLSLL